MAKIGDKVPSATLRMLGPEGPKPITTEELFAPGKKVVAFALPGAFTPTCSMKHLPGFLEQSRAIRGKGVDEIVCLSVNDAFVMGAWGKANDAAGKVRMLADGNGEFARALGLELDATKFGMGMRGKRFSMVVDDGIVTQLNIEEPGAFGVSSGDHMVGQL